METVPAWAFNIALLLIQAIGGLMVLRLWKAVDDNTAAVTKLAIELPTNYATKLEVDRHHGEDVAGFNGIRTHLSELRDRVWNIDKQVAAKEDRK